MCAQAGAEVGIGSEAVRTAGLRAELGARQGGKIAEGLLKNRVVVHFCYAAELVKSLFYATREILPT